jgi:hypothetical protein
VPRDCELACLELVGIGTLRLAETSKRYLRPAGSYRIVACAKGEGGFAKYRIILAHIDLASVNLFPTGNYPNQLSAPQKH